MSTKAVCVLSGDVSGTVHFEQKDDNSPVTVTGQIKGLPKGKHGFHVHEIGDNDNNCASEHSHHHHGAEAELHHVGHLGNLEAAADGGVTEINIKDSHISLIGADNIIGHMLVIHANPDDSSEEHNENAGARIAYGVINLA